MATRKKTKKKKAPPPRDLSDEVRVPALGKTCMFVFECDEEDPKVRAAVENLFRAKPSMLEAASKHVVAYRRDAHAASGEKKPLKKLATPNAVWKEVQLGDEIMVDHREDGDEEDAVYFSLECNCNWEREHGLQIVIRDGKKVSKVGPFDSHLTNADAYDDDELIGVVYASPNRKS